MSINCGIRPKHQLVRIKIFPVVVTLVFTLVPSAHSQEYGHSYLRMEVDGHTIRNFVPNGKYSTGWLGVEGIEVKYPSSTIPPAELSEPPVKVVNAEKAADNRWIKLSSALRSGKSGPGKLKFGAGDSGGMEPLFDAIKNKSVIPQAELDLYTLDGTKLIGRFKIKGIRILSLKDNPVSACGAYIITLSFQSIAKE